LRDTVDRNTPIGCRFDLEAEGCKGIRRAGAVPEEARAHLTRVLGCMLPLLGVNVTGEHGYRLAIGRVVGHCTPMEPRQWNIEVTGASSAMASRRKTLSRETFVTCAVAR
jgi:hypothetical protein